VAARTRTSRAVSAALAAFYDASLSLRTLLDEREESLQARRIGG